MLLSRGKHYLLKTRFRISIIVIATLEQSNKIGISCISLVAYLLLSNAYSGSQCLDSTHLDIASFLGNVPIFPRSVCSVRYEVY